jgi:NAD(P)-dependent dehydrogenase (short-subunit alcohol dehydrogenase family)
MDFHGKVCVVTGASSGIGRRAARDLAAAGARICAVARRAEKLDSLIRELSGTGHTRVVADVSEPDTIRAVADHVERTYGRCDVLLNSAGVSGDIPFDGRDAARRTEEIMRTNFLGAVYCTAELLPFLEASAPSSVVNVASIAGRLPVRGSPGYCASKFALVGWSESIQAELAERGIAVSLIEPGPLPTEGFPHRSLVDDRLTRWVLTSESDVSLAIRRSIARRKVQRVVPRWYYLLQFPRLLAPGLYRAGARWIVRVRDLRR